MGKRNSGEHPVNCSLLASSKPVRLPVSARGKGETMESVKLAIV